MWAFLCSNEEEEGKNHAEVLPDSREKHQLEEDDEKRKAERQGNDHHLQESRKGKR